MTEAVSCMTPRRYLSLGLPSFPTDRVRRRAKADGAALDPDRPLALFAAVKGAQRLSAVDGVARRLGLRAGMALADARALRPELQVAPADRAADRALMLAVADWARRYTPLAADDGEDGVVLDITGAAHLFGGEAALMADALRRLAAQGFSEPAAAIAGTPEAAWALARFAPVPHRLCPPGAEEARLRPLPVAALRLPPAVVEGLTQAGLTRIEDLWLRPRAPVAARFGAGVITRLEAAFGLSRSAIAPRLEVAPYLAERRYADPILTLEDVRRAVVRLSRTLAETLQRHGEGARRLELTLFRVDGATFRISAGASRPTRDPAAIAGLFADKLSHQADERDVAFGFDVLRLAVMEAVRLDEAMVSLDSEDASEALARLADRLAGRLGETAVSRITACDAHLPEAACQAVPLTTERVVGLPWAPMQREGGPPARPILILERPEPIQALAALPDGPPLRFRWRRALHDVARVEGPERITPPWWGQAGGWARAEAMTRDYFRAEDREGRRFWLYREGLYGAKAAPTGPPRWFLHGLFG